MRLFTAMKTFTIVAALLASGTSLAMAHGDFAASRINGDQVLVRTPSGVAAYARTTAPVIRQTVPPNH